MTSPSLRRIALALSVALAACSGGGSDPAPECAVAADCPGTDTECSARTCDAGACGVQLAAAGTPIAAQTAGDCRLETCDGAGEVTSAIDDADVPTGAGECTSATCTEGTAAFAPFPAGTPCSAGVCDATGQCVGCVTGADCAGTDAACSTRTCSVGVCGADFAPAATPCPDGVCDGAGACVGCLVPAHCASRVCVANVCRAPACNDLVKNGAETDVDCGGPDCSRCANGRTCGINADCVSGNCVGGVCVAP